MTRNQVYWYTLLEGKKDTQALQGDISCDVVVIGGGMAGLMCAQELMKAGKAVVLLERKFVGSGASGKSSGFITPDSELELSDLYDSYGEHDAKVLWEFAKGGVKSIHDNINKLGLICDYQTQDSLFVANSKEGMKTIEYEHEVHQRLGYQSHLYSSETLVSVLGTAGYYGGIRYGETFGMVPYLYCQDLKRSLQGQGVKVFEFTDVKQIHRNQVIAKQGSVRAEQIAVCTDYRFKGLGAVSRAVYHAQTFLGITRPLGDDMVNSIFPESKLMVWDTDLIYSYYRLIGDNRLLLGGSNLFYTYQPHTALNTVLVRRKLERHMHLKFPILRNVDFEYLWPGFIGVTKDFLPVAGTVVGTDNIHYVGGAAGLPWAAALGQYIAQKIISGRQDMDHYFSAERDFFISGKTQALLTRPASFALAHAYEKFFK